LIPLSVSLDFIFHSTYEWHRGAEEISANGLGADALVGECIFLENKNKPPPEASDDDEEEEEEEDEDEPKKL
jgi:hypothetical protein